MGRLEGIKESILLRFRTGGNLDTKGTQATELGRRTEPSEGTRESSLLAHLMRRASHLVFESNQSQDFHPKDYKGVFKLRVSVSVKKKKLSFRPLASECMKKQLYESLTLFECSM